MTTLECFKLFALMASPLVFSLIIGGIWEGIEYRRAETVKDQPVADVVEVRHGKWIEDHEFFKCSECGCLTDYRLSNFCPNCGAKMDGKVGDEK